MKSRLDLPKIIKHNGVAVELGVATGYYSDVILKNIKLAYLYSIDSWCDHHNEEEYKYAKRLLSAHGHRSIIMRMTFDEAIKRFPDNFFDFIYVDAYAHTGQEDGLIMRDWYSKLKIGGVMSGHDYSKRYLPTIEAVDKFCADIGKEAIIISGTNQTGNIQDKNASWFIIKE